MCIRDRDSGTGHAHLPGGLLLGQIQQVHQPDGFKLIHRHLNGLLVPVPFQVTKPAAAWQGAHAPAFTRPWQLPTSLLFLSYANYTTQQGEGQGQGAKKKGAPPPAHFPQRKNTAPVGPCSLVASIFYGPSVTGASGTPWRAGAGSRCRACPGTSRPRWPRHPGAQTTPGGIPPAVAASP